MIGYAYMSGHLRSQQICAIPTSRVGADAHHIQFWPPWPLHESLPVRAHEKNSENCYGDVELGTKVYRSGALKSNVVQCSLSMSLSALGKSRFCQGFCTMMVLEVAKTKTRASPPQLQADPREATRKSLGTHWGIRRRF